MTTPPSHDPDTSQEEEKDHDKEIKRYQVLLQQQENQPGGKGSEYATTLRKIGDFYERMGEYNRAFNYYKQALKIFKKKAQKGAIEAFEYGKTISKVAIIYDHQGNYHSALKLFKQALKIFEKQAGKKEETYGVILRNIAVVYHHLGKYSTAMKYLHQAKKVLKEKLGSGSSGIWRSSSANWRDPRSTRAIQRSIEVFE